jgi:Protein of unknown function (DUF1552)
MKTTHRRQFMRGAGVAIALPWLESLAGKTAKAESVKKRYISLYFPNGTANYWRPASAGEANGWKLSPILEPLAPVKKHLTVLTNVSNYAPFGNRHIEPAHSNLCSSTWTSVPASDRTGKILDGGDAAVNSGTSVDQVIAEAIGGSTPFPSLQVGLSTRDSYVDGLPPQHSRSISWKTSAQPLYKVINPQAVFDRLMVGSGSGAAPSPADALEAKKRVALKKSVLDAVSDMSLNLQGRLGKSDKVRMDEFLSSIRALEKRVGATEMQLSSGGCKKMARPSFSAAVYITYPSIGTTPTNYNRGEHARIMNELVVMALQCDLTRVVSYMLDDARSNFVYNFLKTRKFSAAGSVEGTDPVGGYHDLSHLSDINDAFATIGRWNAEQAADIAGKLAAIDDGGGKSMLDNTVIAFASGMHGPNHDARNLPVALIGGGGGVLKTDHNVVFSTEQRLADVHLTIIQKVFGINLPKFGASSGPIAALLA